VPPQPSVNHDHRHFFPPVRRFRRIRKLIVRRLVGRIWWLVWRIWRVFVRRTRRLFFRRLWRIFIGRIWRLVVRRIWRLVVRQRVVIRRLVRDRRPQRMEAPGSQAVCSPLPHRFRRLPHLRLGQQ